MTSALVYGCMALGGPWDDSPVAVAQVDAARTAVHTALDAGVELFDHADIYANGKSERVFGQLLREDPSLRSRVTLQTKCGIKLPGNTGPADSVVHYRQDRDSVRASVEGSLERLGVDHVERLFLHRPDPLTPLDETARALDELREEGLITSVGLSNITSAHVMTLERLMETPLTAVQLQLSLAHRDFVESAVLANHQEGREHTFPVGLLEHCVAQGIEIQAWGAMANGLYSGAPTDGDHRAEAASGVVGEMAARLGVPREAVVVGWLLRHPSAPRPVVGTMNPERIRACARAREAAGAMTHEDWYALWTAARGHALP